MHIRSHQTLSWYKHGLIQWPSATKSKVETDDHIVEITHIAKTFASNQCFIDVDRKVFVVGPI